MACEHSTTSREPSTLVVSLFAPAGASTPGGKTSGSGTCYVFDVAAMPPHDRKAALRLLAAVLENEQLIKVADHRSFGCGCCFCACIGAGLVRGPPAVAKGPEIGLLRCWLLASV